MERRNEHASTSEKTVGRADVETGRPGRRKWKDLSEDERGTAARLFNRAVGAQVAVWDAIRSLELELEWELELDFDEDGIDDIVEEAAISRRELTEVEVGEWLKKLLVNGGEDEEG